tara:strand:+ start:231 stop:734 length:504 start_codon:yes stop_codon:yes gene_type:complete
MILNPFKYFIKRYYSVDLKPSELKRMLNLWIPFIFNRIRIIRVSDDFRKIDVRLKLSFWNRNPGKAIWGGAIFSAADSFYPIMLKQNALYSGITTQFFTKSTQVNYIKESKTNLMFNFELTEDEVLNMIETLNENGKYQDWHTVYGIDESNNKCVEVKIQPYLRVHV